MHYRLATAADAGALAAMNGQLIRDEGHRTRMTPAELEARMAGFLADYQAVLFEDDGLAIGYALFKREPEWIYLRQFYVRGEQRRRGVGRAAIAWLRDQAWQDRRVRIDVLVDNRGGIAFWRAVGFVDYCLTMEMDPAQRP